MDIIIHRIHICRHRIIIFNKESNHRGAPRPCGARPKAAPLLSLLNMMILCLHIWILCIIISISHLFGMIFQIMMIIPYLSPLEPFQTLVKFTIGVLHRYPGKRQHLA